MVTKITLLVTMIFMRNFWRYGFVGFLWGVPIPLVVLNIDLTAHGLGWNFAAITSMFAARPMHWFYLLHPIFFALVFGWFGHIRSLLDDLRQKEILRYQEASRMDGLTGLVNHATFYETLHAEIDRVRRSPAKPVAFSLVMLDIDFFKKINDTRGHLLGDRVLEEIGAILRGLIRTYDTAARYGGEEFALLLPETSLEAAALNAERIREAVETHVFAEQIRVTVSLGVATLRSGEEAEGLISRADAALYRAKSEGRNRVV